MYLANFLTHKNVNILKKLTINEILCANYRNLLESGAERSQPEQCGWNNHWRSGFQTFILGFAPWIPNYQHSDNELSINMHSAENGKQQGLSK
jgi:hypothetical protein